MDNRNTAWEPRLNNHGPFVVEIGDIPLDFQDKADLPTPANPLRVLFDLHEAKPLVVALCRSLTSLDFIFQRPRFYMFRSKARAEV
jgi:hypothetical protein